MWLSVVEKPAICSSSRDSFKPNKQTDVALFLFDKLTHRRLITRSRSFHFLFFELLGFATLGLERNAIGPLTSEKKGFSLHASTSPRVPPTLEVSGGKRFYMRSIQIPLLLNSQLDDKD